MAKILIVDDIPLNRQLLSTILGYSGHEILEAGGGEEALSLMALTKPDLIISDIVMPKLDGLQFVRLLHIDPDFSEIPIIFYTASFMRKQAYTVAKACGVTHVLFKPADPQVILAMVNSVLHGGGASEAVSVGSTEEQALVIAGQYVEASGQARILNMRLAALTEITLRLSSQNDALLLTEGFCQAAGMILDAQYAAVGILHPDGEALLHYCSNVSDLELFPSETPAARDGVFKSILAERRSYRWPQGDKHNGQSGANSETLTSNHLGLPSSYPPVKAFLGLPIFTTTKTYGWLYALNKNSGEEFSDEDAGLGAMLAAKMAVFLENVNLLNASRNQSRALEAEMEARKIAEQREAEARLAELNAAASIFRNAPAGIIRIASDFRITATNDTFAKGFNLSPKDIVNKCLFDVLPNLPQELVLDAIKTGVPLHRESDKLVLTTDGDKEDTYWDVTLWPVEGTQSENGGAVLMATDVSERVRVSQQREDFVATLTHDLRIPLIGTEQILNGLLDDPTGLNGRQIKYLALIKSGNHDLLQMINNLLDIYRMDAGVEVFKSEALDLNAVIASCVEEFLPLAEHRGLQIRYQKPDQPALIAGDRLALRRVLVNLIGNALKFMDPGGTIDITLERDNEKTLVSVKDTGKGIPERDRPKLFRRYWRGESGRTYAASTGLGLYLCRQIVEAHGGQIGCESEVGKGSTFCMTIPRSESVLHAQSAS